MKETKEEFALTLRFKGIESKLIDRAIKNGLFSSKSELIRAALIHYFMKLGLLGREKQWEEIQTFPKRKITAEQLAKDLEKLEDETE